MNTSKWGPSGWNQLGPVAYKYDKIRAVLSEQHKNTYMIIHKIHLSNTENMLPCKYCRESYHKYLLDTPMDKPLFSNLNKWMYTIHNKVNDKLRKQGYNTAPDPTSTGSTWNRESPKRDDPSSSCKYAILSASWRTSLRKVFHKGVAASLGDILV